jgi:hypothetical protein
MPPRSWLGRRELWATIAPVVLALACSGGSARAQSRTADAVAAARDALAPTGRLRAALIRSNPVLVRRDAATGRYRAEGDRIVIAVDVAWQPGWEGREHVCFVDLDGDGMTLRTGVREPPSAPGGRCVGTVAWERER